MGVKQELMQARQRRKSLSPKDVVEFARNNPGSETWKSFDRNGLWDDKIAAEKMRLEHGRGLIRRYKVNIITPEGSKQPVRALVSLTEERDRERSYSARVDILSNEERLASLKRDYARDVETLIRRYADVLTREAIELHRQAVAIIVVPEEADEDVA